jgi:hypothetical protein
MSKKSSTLPPLNPRPLYVAEDGPAPPLKLYKNKSAALRSLHETVSDLHDVGVVDVATMDRFDKSCLKRGRPAKTLADKPWIAAGISRMTWHRRQKRTKAI